MTTVILFGLENAMRLIASTVIVQLNFSIKTIHDMEVWRRMSVNYSIFWTVVAYELGKP